MGNRARCRSTIRRRHSRCNRCRRCRTPRRWGRSIPGMRPSRQTPPRRRSAGRRSSLPTLRLPGAVPAKHGWNVTRRAATGLVDQAVAIVVQPVARAAVAAQLHRPATGIRGNRIGARRGDVGRDADTRVGASQVAIGRARPVARLDRRHVAATPLHVAGRDATIGVLVVATRKGAASRDSERAGKAQHREVSHRRQPPSGRRAGI